MPAGMGPAYLRAVRRGELQAGLRLGEVLQAAGHRRDARLTLPAIAPNLVTSATALADLAAFLATFWLVSGCVVKVVSLSALRPPAWGITAAIYALLAIVFALVATIFGLWNLPDPGRLGLSSRHTACPWAGVCGVPGQRGAKQLERILVAEKRTLLYACLCTDQHDHACRMSVTSVIKTGVS